MAKDVIAELVNIALQVPVCSDPAEEEVRLHREITKTLAMPRPGPTPWYQRDQPLRKVEAGDGRHAGWCTRCGGDTFDGIHHRCPPKLSAGVLAAIVEAKLYRDARLDLRAASGELIRKQFEAKEAAAFDNLVRALCAVDGGE